MQPIRIDVDVFLKELGDAHGGQSRPVLVLGSDFETYVLKTQYTQKGHWDVMFLQELLALHIAEFLGIPTPQCAIANVSDSFLNKAPSLRFTHRFTQGIHFASRWLDQAENNLMQGFQQLLLTGKPYIKRTWTSFFSGISNPEDATKLIVLDILTGNFDRFGNHGNLLIASRDGKRTIYAIDHGHSFYGPRWEQTKIQFLSSPSTSDQYTQWYASELQRNRGMGAQFTGLGTIFRALDQFISIPSSSSNPFLPIVQKIGKINEATIDIWFSTVPDDWFIDKPTQIARYKHFLLHQRDCVPLILDFLAANGAFDNHLGGVLEWNVSPTGTP